MLNPKILKVVLDSPEVMAFQGDFNLNMFPDLGLQIAFENLEMYARRPSLKDVASEYLDIELDKTFRNFDFRWRLLLQNVINYARLDSKILLECYEELILRQFQW